MNNIDKTIEYYNENVAKFVADSIDVEFSEIQNEFMSFVNKGGRILDLGCGSGRDSKKFLEMGYSVTAIDGSVEIAKKAGEYIGQNVICSTFQDFVPEETYDAIWACASLLHLTKEDTIMTLNKLKNCLIKDGIFYVSFKYGSFHGERNGRYFTDYTEDSFSDLMKAVSGIEILKTFITSDARPNRKSEYWLNAYLIKK